LIDFVGKRYWYFLFSALILIPGIFSLSLVGLRRGIEFDSGSMMTIRFERDVGQSELRQELSDQGYADAIIQRTDDGDFIIRTVGLTTPQKEELQEALKEEFGTLEERAFHSVSPIVAREIERNAFYAVLAAAVAILIYITWAFRRLPSPFRYGTCAIIALVHDVLIVLGIFSILGRAFNLEINAMFIMGILTVIGYSVNDTIVVFDRIRENMGKGISDDFRTTVNTSLVETLGRSLNTSLTTLFVLVALFLFGGATIQSLVLALIIGVISGTYSSLFIASQLLVVWENKDLSRLARGWRNVIRSSPTR
jgi:preprotein translocase subunit SecF